MLVTFGTTATIKNPTRPEPTIIIRDEKTRPCADALIRTAASPTGQPWEIKLRPQGSSETKNNIEVWLPRTGGPMAN